MMTFEVFCRRVMTLRNSREYICKLSTLFSHVCRSDIVSFDGVVLVSFVAQVRNIMFYDFGVPGACRGESFVVARRPDNACNAKYLNVTLVRDPYCLGHAEASMATCLSPIIRDLHGSQPRKSLLHLDYAIRGPSTLNHTPAFIRIVRHSSVNNFIILSQRRQINRQFKSCMYKRLCCFAKMKIVTRST